MEYIRYINKNNSLNNRNNYLFSLIAGKEEKEVYKYPRLKTGTTKIESEAIKFEAYLKYSKGFIALKHLIILLLCLYIHCAR